VCLVPRRDLQRRSVNLDKALSGKPGSDGGRNSVPLQQKGSSGGMHSGTPERRTFRHSDGPNLAPEGLVTGVRIAMLRRESAAPAHLPVRD
jgi:hypothetical protein